VNNTKPGVYRGYYDSHGTHVKTRSLYLKQLEDRLDSIAVENITIPEQRIGNIYNLLADWAGEGPLIDTNGLRLAAPGNLRPLAYAYSDSSGFVILGWEDNSADEKHFILERSSDGGEHFDTLVVLNENTESYRDTNILQDHYHYRLKAVNDSLFSAYTNIHVDLLETLPSVDITFRVNMSEITDLHTGGSVWLSGDYWESQPLMLDENRDSIFEIELSMPVGMNLKYKFAYQNGPDPAVNFIKENVTGNCGNEEGLRTLGVPKTKLVLPAVLFDSCKEASLSGYDITDLEGTVITGSNDDEPWISGSEGAGSPPGEGISMLIDNDIQTKYLVRAVTSWIEIANNRYSVVTGYTITSANDSPSRDPRSWRLQGYNEATGYWVDIHSVSNNPVWPDFHTPRSWTFENDKSYSKYRLVITAINGDSQGLMQMAELQIFGELGDIVAIKNVDAGSFSIYPNPTEGIVIIHNTDSKIYRYGVYSISGKLVSEKQNNTGARTQVDLSGLSKGLYIIKVSTPDLLYRQKVILH